MKRQESKQYNSTWIVKWSYQVDQIVAIESGNDFYC